MTTLEGAAPAVTTRRLPPGSTGLPLLGETLDFLRNPYAFVEDRAARHGRVFRTSLFGKPTAVLVGPEAAARFIDPALVAREGSQPSPVFRLFAGPSVPHLDGEAFLVRKKALLRAFSREALTAYLPRTQALVEEHLGRWAAQPEVGLVAATKRLALEAVAQDLLGVTDPAARDDLDRWYGELDLAFTGLPIPAPFTRYGKGLAAVERILAFFRRVVAEHRARAADEGGAGDGLARVLAAGTLSDDEAAREMHHFVIAGRVVYAHLVGAVLQLAAHPEARERLERELAARAPARALTVEGLYALVDLQLALLEIKRVTPVVPGMFGRALADITVDGYTIPRGWGLMFGLRQGLLDGSVFHAPERFDPDRFADGRAEHQRHPHAFAPHGPGQPATSHHCAGTDYASQLAKVFLVTLVRDFRVELPEQDLAYDFARLTPDPKGGLRARVTRR